MMQNNNDNRLDYYWFQILYSVVPYCPDHSCPWLRKPHCLEEMRVSVQKYLNNLKLPQLYSSSVICNKEMDIGNFCHDF